MAGRGPQSAYRVALSQQDKVLEEHFLAFIKGSGGEWGPKAAEDLRRCIARARATGNMGSFGTHVARLILAEAADNGYAPREARTNATEGSAS